MNIATAIEGGLTGATTLSLLQEALHKINTGTPRPLLHKSGLIKQLKKNEGKNNSKTTELYIKLAGELLANAAFFGLSGLGKKKNAVLRGVLLGAAAGLGSAFLTGDDKEEKGKEVNSLKDMNGHINRHQGERDDMKKKILTVGLYTAGGLLAGMAIKKLDNNKKKKKK